MKTFRKSHSAENRNARREMTRSGRAGGARAALLQPDVVLAGGRFRRANRLDHVQAARLEVLLHNGDGILVRPTLNLHMDPLSRLVNGFTLTTD